MLKFFFVNILVLFCGFTYAQQRPVTLEQSRQAALAYSTAIKNGTLRVRSAEAEVAGAKTEYLPSVSGTGFGLYGFKDLIGAMPPYIPNSINNFYFLGVTGTQSIYAGGRIRTGNKLASLQLEVNIILASQSVDSVLLITEQKYWNIVNLQEQSKTLDANRRLLDAVLKQQQDLLASGMIARNDMLKVSVQRSQLLLNQSRLENGRRLALLDFSMYTGMPYDSLMVMADTLTNHALPLLPDAAPDTSLANNSSYQLLKKSVDAEQLQTQLTRGEYLPSVSAGLSAAQTGVIGKEIGSNFMPVAFATLSVPISANWWGKGKSKLRQRAISETIARNNLTDVSNQLKVVIVKSWYDLIDGLKEIAYARENLQQATENLHVNQDNYKAGLVSISELLDAQASYQQASSDLIIAYANYQSRTVVYYYSIGRIREK